jgi:type IV pilus assembly protein PilX
MMTMRAFKHNQNGVVLFIALVALVVMSIAAAALIRNVDTNTKIAGNLSFKQSALISSDRGVEAAMAWIQTTANVDVNNLNTSSSANGYYAIYGDLDINPATTPALNLDDPAVLKDNSVWANYSVPATGTGITGGQENDSKNTINYIIERMCTAELAPANDVNNKCLFGESDPGGGSKGVKTAEQAGAIINSSASPIYRVTVRVTGPQNTQVFSQAYAY